MKMRAFSLAILLSLAPIAVAQDMLAPRTDIDALRKEAMADRAIRAAVADPSRSMESALKDDRRDVRVILKASKVKVGDRVLDIGSGGAYLAVLFSSLVGPAGHVDIHNTPSWIAQFPRMAKEKQSKWITNPNVGWVAQAWNDIEAPAESYDLVVLGRVYHDVLVESGDHELLNQRIFAMLKPGGRVLVEDHDADPEMRVDKQVFLHRIGRDHVTEHFTSAGFALTEMILFDSKDDNQTTDVFRPGVRGKTDHYIAVFQKPLR